MAEQLRHIEVVAAVVHDPDMRFLLAFNARWGGYSFPSTKVKPQLTLEQLAIQAFRDHVPAQLLDPNVQPTATPLEFIGAFGPSWGVAEDTYYDYHVFEVDPKQTLHSGNFGDWCGFLAYEDLMRSPLVTWSTKEIARGLVEYQEIALGVICRQSTRGREFLLVEKARYNGYFFPVARVKTDAKPDEAVREAIQSDTRYAGPITISGQTECELLQASPRYGRNRMYRFHLRNVSLPRVDLAVPANALEQSLNNAGITWRWFTGDELSKPPGGIDLSQTMPAVRTYVVSTAGS